MVIVTFVYCPGSLFNITSRRIINKSLAVGDAKLSSFSSCVQDTFLHQDRHTELGVISRVAIKQPD